MKAEIEWLCFPWNFYFYELERLCFLLPSADNSFWVVSNTIVASSTRIRFKGSGRVLGRVVYCMHPSPCLFSQTGCFHDPKLWSSIHKVANSGESCWIYRDWKTRKENQIDDTRPTSLPYRGSCFPSHLLFLSANCGHASFYIVPLLFSSSSPSHFRFLSPLLLTSLYSFFTILLFSLVQSTENKLVSDNVFSYRALD